MSVLSGTLTKYDMVGIREDLSDVIYNISPMATPVLSMAGRGPKTEQTLTEWQTDSLAAADDTNARIEGDEKTFSTPAPTVRVGNYTQISDKTLILSGTAQAVNTAGRKNEKAYQIAKRGKELKRDQEKILLAAQAGDAGGVDTARTLAAFNAWVKTNVNLAGDGGNPTYSAGVPSAVRTDGSQRAFTETILKDVMQQCFTEGAEPKFLFVGPFNKTVVSSFTGIATRNIDLANAAAKPMAVVAAVDVYVTDFGALRVMPSRFQRERDAWFFDPEYFTVRYLRPHKTEPLAKTGDAEKSLLLCEWTLQVKQEAALGLAADLDAS